MAIHWCDPYLNTSTGGIHGTTTSGQSSGDGSYASPWSLTELNNQSNYSSWSDGDELRFKGLAEDTFFPPANSTTFKQSNQTTDYVANTNYNGYYNTSIYLSSVDSGNKFIKIKQQDRGTLPGKIFYYKQYNTDRISTMLDSNTWYPNVPPLDIPYGYIPFDDRYQITVNMNGGSTGEFLRYITARIKITAGWTSETQQTGVTILDSNSTSVFGSTCYWGGNQNNENTYRMPIWDCEDTLIFSRIGQSSSWYIFAAVLKLKALVEAGNNYSSWYNYVGSASSANLGSMPAGYNMGDMTIDTIVICNCRFYFYGANYSPHLDPPSINIPFICDYGAQQDRFITNVTNTYYLKEYYGYSAFIWSGDSNINYKFDLANDWNFEMGYYNDPSSFSFNNSYTDNQRAYIASNSIVGTQGDSYATLGGWSSITKSIAFALYTIQPEGYGIKGSNTTEKVNFSNGLFDQINYNTSWNVMGFIESANSLGVPLEDTIVSPLNFSQSVSYPWQMRLNVRQEPGRMLPITLLQPTSIGKAAMLYNSPNFSYKKAIRFFQECNGLSYVDVVAYDMPTFSNNVTYNAEYTTTSTPGVSLINKLYLYDTSTQRFELIQNVYGSVNGTTITCNTTISSSTLTNKAGLLIVLHDFSKTSADVAEVAYNSVTVT